MAKSKNKFTTWLAGGVVLILIVVLIAVIVVTLRQTNNFTDDFKSFYIERGNTVYASTDYVKLDLQEKASFEVKYLIEDKENRKGYSVKVLSYATSETQFEYTLDGEPALYGANSNFDLSAAFALDVQDGYFTITAPNSFQAVLETMHPGKQISIPETVNEAETPYFVVVVTSFNELYTRKLHLTFTPYVDVGGVKLPGEDIIF